MKNLISSLIELPTSLKKLFSRTKSSMSSSLTLKCLQMKMRQLGPRQTQSMQFHEHSLSKVTVRIRVFPALSSTRLCHILSQWVSSKTFHSKTELKWWASHTSHTFWSLTSQTVRSFIWNTLFNLQSRFHASNSIQRTLKCSLLVQSTVSLSRGT